MSGGRKLEAPEFRLTQIYDGTKMTDCGPIRAPAMPRWQTENIDELIGTLTGTAPKKATKKAAKKTPGGIALPALPTAAAAPVVQHTEAGFLKELAWRDVEDGGVSEAKFKRCVREMGPAVAVQAVRAINELVDVLAPYNITEDEAAHFYLRGPEVVNNIRDAPMLCEYFRTQKPAYPLCAPILERAQ